MRDALPGRMVDNPAPTCQTWCMRSLTCIRIASGRLVDLAALRPEDILLSDIAASLAHQERFTGHCPLHPTVAQHSLAVERIAAELFDGEAVPRSLRRAALMHDAAEAYVSDVSAPAKRRLRQYEDARILSGFDLMEADAALAVACRFDCSPAGWESLIHEADLLAYAYEMSWAGWGEPEGGPPPEWVAPLVKDCYFGSGYESGGGAGFLRRANALGMRDA